jgi:hypothetical protein
MLLGAPSQEGRCQARAPTSGSGPAPAGCPRLCRPLNRDVRRHRSAFTDKHLDLEFSETAERVS